MFKIQNTTFRHTLGYPDIIECLLDNSDSVIYELPKEHDADIFNSNLLFQITTTDKLLGFGADFKNKQYQPVLSTTEYLNGKPKTIGFIEAH